MLSNQIINWYIENKRELPWRDTKDPYLIWISEIMLQQTRVITATDYFYRFTNRFPTVQDLAEAEEEEVLNLWQGLGYYSRARNLHHAAKTICNEYKGMFPSSYNEILKLKGIGTYTAAAIASFAYNLPYAVLDGNVFRVLSRLYGIATPIDSTQGKKEFQKLATETMGNARPELYNQAIIELGALQCTPKNPDCETCPLLYNCFAYQQKQVDQFPKKEKQIKLKNRYFYYLFLYCKSQFVVEKRSKNDIWKNMYQYPLIESDVEVSIKQLMQFREWDEYFGGENVTIQSQTNVLVHKLSHQNLHTVFIHIHTNLSAFEKNKRFKLIGFDEQHKYPFPKLIENHLSKLTGSKNY